MSKTVGIGDLRRNLGAYLARAARGESFEVTHRGQPVGRLVPPSTAEPWIEVLVAQGRVRPARRRSKVFPRLVSSAGFSISDALALERSDRIP